MNTVKFVKVDNKGLVKTVESLANTIWREHYTPIIGEAQVEYMLDKFQSAQAIDAQIKDGHVYYLVYDGESQNIGYFGVLIQDNELFLNRIYLKSIVRGKGFGRQSLNFMEELARENHCSKIWLTVNKDNSGSIEAYQKCGFKIIGPIVQDIGQGFIMDDYKLEKLL